MDIVAVKKDNPKIRISVHEVFNTTFSGRVLEGDGVWKEGGYMNALHINSFHIHIPFEQLKGLLRILSK